MDLGLEAAWQRNGAGLAGRLQEQISGLETAELWLRQHLPTLPPAAAGLDGQLAQLAWQAAHQPLQELFDRGGKRFRSLLHLCQSQAEGQPAGVLLLVSELVHTASLIADDIEDGAALRRHLPSMHQIYGVGQALNSSNWGYFLVSSVLEQAALSDQQQLDFYRCYHLTLQQLHLGQALDIYWHDHPQLWPLSSDYLRMCRLKTGALVRFSCESALIPLAINAERRQQLAQLWEDVGQAFQMIDDLQNLAGGNDGKLPGDDLIEGKKSWPLLYLLENVSAEKRRDWQHWLEESIAAVQGQPDDGELRARICAQLLESKILPAARRQVEVLLQNCWQRLAHLYHRHENTAGLADLLLLCYRGLEPLR